MNDDNQKVIDMSSHQRTAQPKITQNDGHNGNNGNIIRYRLEQVEKDVKEIKLEHKNISRTLYHINGSIENISGKLDKMPGPFQYWLGTIVALAAITGIIFAILQYTKT